MTLLFYAWAVISTCACLLVWAKKNFFLATLCAIACLAAGVALGIIA